jgi:hypothetical protein
LADRIACDGIDTHGNAKGKWSSMVELLSIRADWTYGIMVACDLTRNRRWCARYATMSDPFSSPNCSGLTLS